MFPKVEAGNTNCSKYTGYSTTIKPNTCRTVRSHWTGQVSHSALLLAHKTLRRVPSTILLHGWLRWAKCFLTSRHVESRDMQVTWPPALLSWQCLFSTRSIKIFGTVRNPYNLWNYKIYNLLFCVRYSIQLYWKYCPSLNCKLFVIFLVSL